MNQSKLKTVTRRDFTKPVKVQCTEAGCDRTEEMPIRVRNNPEHPGYWCDGEYGARHDLRLMVGPDGLSYR